MTGVQISFGLFDTTAREDSSPSCLDRQPFVDLEDLREEEAPPRPKYATLEEDIFFLDGSFEPFPDEPQGEFWGLWSQSMSGEDRAFKNPPVLTLSFSEPHSSLGLTLSFAEETGDYADHLKAVWYDGSGTAIAAKDFRPDGPTCFLEQKVEGYRKIVLTFYRTSRAWRYLKLSSIGYGLEKLLGSGEIVSASILEETDPISSELAVNTLDFTLHSEDADFSLLNPQGLFSLLQQRQRLTVTELVDGEQVPMGDYYLDSWENGSENGVRMSAVDLVGVLDQTSFAGGLYDNIPAGELVAQIMASADVPYALDPALAGQALSGYLPICTHREALQQAAFALCAVVDCSRSDRVRIFPPPVRPSAKIGHDRKLSGGTVRLRSLVTGVDVTAHKYLPNTETRELFSDMLEPGEVEITFDQPAHSLAVTGGTVRESGVNRAVIAVTAAGEVTLTGQGYTDSRRIVSKRMIPLPANTPQNVLKVEEATLVSSHNAAAVAQHVYDYYQQRVENEFRMVAGGEVNGDKVVIDSLRGERIKGVIESMDIDLTGGFIARCRVAGVRIETISGYYTGELHTGEEMGVL